MAITKRVGRQRVELIPLWFCRVRSSLDSSWSRVLSTLRGYPRLNEGIALTCRPSVRRAVLRGGRGRLHTSKICSGMQSMKHVLFILPTLLDSC